MFREETLPRPSSLTHSSALCWCPKAPRTGKHSIMAAPASVSQGKLVARCATPSSTPSASSSGPGRHCRPHLQGSKARKDGTLVPTEKHSASDPGHPQPLSVPQNV